MSFEFGQTFLQFLHPVHSEFFAQLIEHGLGDDQFAHHIDERVHLIDSDADGAGFSVGLLLRRRGRCLRFGLLSAGLGLLYGFTRACLIGLNFNGACVVPARGFTLFKMRF